MTLLHKPADFWTDTTALYAEMLPQMEQDLETWVPQSPVERYARTALNCVITNVRAALALMQFSQSQTVYHQAALVQFSDSVSYCEHLAKVEEMLNAAIQGLRASRYARECSIADTGITRQDLLWQDRLIEYLISLQEKLQIFRQNSLSIVSLPCFTEFLYSWEFGKGGLVP